VEFRILGLLEVVDGDEAVEVRGAKQRALLAMLVLHANRVVSAENLVDALWGEDPPPSAANTLQGYVSHLRRALGARYIVTRPPGYVLDADPSAIDALCFARLATDGRRALDDGDGARALASLDAALSLWRGSALADFPYDQFAQSDAARLEEMRLVAVEDHVDAELALGRHSEAVGRLQALVDRHPLRERLWAALMLALYRCGRQAESLRAYQSLRKQLADELGIEPSPALQRLEEAVLLQKPDLDPEPTVARRRGRAPLPVRLDRDTDLPAFVGRETQVRLLENALQGVRDHRRRRVVLVGGEPGIGKTTLVGEFAKTADDRGAIVIYGRCDEDLGIPYQPWAGALGHLVTHPPTDAVADIAAAHGADLARLGPALAHLGEGGGGGSSDPETARYLLFGTVLRVLQAAGRDRPVVLVLEDLQWADPPSLRLLRHLVGSDQEVALLVVGTFRDSDLGTSSVLADVLAWLHREPGVDRITLGGLSDAELLALMEAQAGQTIEGVGLVLRDALARETNGNPFFVGELLRHLVENGVIYRHGDHWDIKGDLREQALPVSVREVIGRRVARLGEKAVRVLSWGAVIGRDFDLDILASAADASEDVLLDALDAAVAATLVVNVSGERYSFVHALVERALYDSLTPARRARAHRGVADAIEAACGADPDPRVGELAYHYAQAGPGSAVKAIAYARAAGDRARARLAPDEALRWYGQALGLLDQQRADDPELRCVLLVGMGDAQRQTGDAAFGETLIEAGRIAQRIGDSASLTAAALANNRGIQSASGHVDADRVAMIEAAILAGGDEDGPSHARLLSLLALERGFDGDYPKRRALADQALAMARRLGDPDTLLDVLNRRHDALRVPESLADRLADTAEAEALAARQRDPIRRFWSAINRMSTAIESGDVVTATRCQREATELAAAIGQPTLRWVVAFARCWRVLLTGDADEAEVAAIEALQLGTDTGQPDTAFFFGVQQAAIRWHQGRDGELIDMIAAMAADTPQFPAFRAGLARLLADADRFDEARALLGRESEAGFPHPHDGQLSSHLAFWAEVVARVGDPVDADRIYRRLSPWADHVLYTGITVYGAVAHYVGLLDTVLGRYEAAEAHFTRALAVHAELGAPFHLARTHLEWGRMLLARDPADGSGAARSHLQTAHDLAARHGCTLVERRATELLVHR